VVVHVLGRRVKVLVVGRVVGVMTWANSVTVVLRRVQVVVHVIFVVLYTVAMFQQRLRGFLEKVADVVCLRPASDQFCRHAAVHISAAIPQK
jgi:hypothetical protein